VFKSNQKLKQPNTHTIEWCRVAITKLGRLRVTKDGIDPLNNALLVVVIDQDVHIRVILEQTRPKMVLEEVSLCGWIPMHALIGQGACPRLVLDGDCPGLQIHGLIGREELGEVESPRVVVFRAKDAVEASGWKA
jgi:hypothetical protein